MRPQRMTMQRISEPSQRDARRQTILDLVARRRIRNQAELKDQLARSGHSVNQGTLSRDLRDMGLVKGREGYELPSDLRPIDDTGPALLVQAVRQWLTRTSPAVNLLVLHTPAGGAAPLAVALDQASLRGVVGTIAGDDTVLVICKTAAEARRLHRELQQMKGQGT